MSSLTGAQGGGIVATGDLALAVQLVSGFLGLVVLVSLVLNVAVTLRRERDDAATREFVRDLKDQARQHEIRFVEEYSVGVDEARRRLEEVGAGFASIVTYLTRSIPEDFLTPEVDPS